MEQFCDGLDDFTYVVCLFRFVIFQMLVMLIQSVKSECSSRCSFFFSVGDSCFPMFMLHFGFS